QREGDPDRRIAGLRPHRLAVELLRPLERAARRALLGVPERRRAGSVHARQLVAVPTLQQPPRLLVLEPPRILLERLLETLQSALEPILFEIAEAQLEDRLL